MNYPKLFDDFKINYSTKVNKGWTNITCPFCDDRTFNGGFNNSKDYFHCWKCGGHDLEKALSLVLSVSRSEVEKVIKNYQTRIILHHQLNQKEKRINKLVLPSDDLDEACKNYLVKRNFNPKLLHQKYNLVSGGIVGKWKYRIIIPLLYNGRIVSWQGRTILSNKLQEELKIPRYKNLSIDQSIIDPKSTLYNLDNCNSDTGVMVEGPFDVMRMGDGFFCTFGTELTQKQISIISNKFQKLFILFDSEKKAQEKAKDIGMLISSLGVEVEVVDAFSDFGKNDAGELSNSEAKRLRKELGL